MRRKGAGRELHSLWVQRARDARGERARQERVAAGNTCRGEERGAAHGGQKQGAQPAHGAGNPVCPRQGHLSSSRRAQCCHPAGEGRGEGWRGQPVLPVANSPSFLLDISARVCVCWCVEGWSLLLHPPLSPCQRAAGRAQAGMLLGFLEGSMPLGGTKKLR